MGSIGQILTSIKKGSPQAPYIYSNSEFFTSNRLTDHFSKQANCKKTQQASWSVEKKTNGDGSTEAFVLRVALSSLAWSSKTHTPEEKAFYCQKLCSMTWMFGDQDDPYNYNQILFLSSLLFTVTILCSFTCLFFPSLRSVRH